MTRQMSSESGHNRINPILQANSTKQLPVASLLALVMSRGPPAHLIGTQAFLPALISYIRNVAAPASLPLDHVIFQSILLCLIAGDNHLILRTPEEDVGLVVRLAVWVSSFQL